VKQQKTMSSLKENAAQIARRRGAKEREGRFVDVPGHLPSRSVLFESIEQALGIVVMVDASNP
jgi:hypothetical protein